MSKQSLLLIGAGNIGRRHLQGILLAKNQLNIFVVEPVEVTRSLIEQAVTESGGLGQHSLQIVSSLDEIEQNDFEITIIATSADVRKKVLLDFLEKKSAKYLVLEKVLFQKNEDYKTVGKILYERKIKTFVNCTRRYFPHYQAIKKEIAGSIFMEMNVSGSNWGLACNTIHLLDLFNYFNDFTDYHFENSGIEKIIYESKRKGFIEFTGTIKTNSKDLFQFSATSNNTIGKPLIVVLKTDRTEFVINETKGEISVRNIFTDEILSSPSILETTGDMLEYKALPLSQSANLFVDDLLNTGNCLLTDYFISAKLHLALLKCYETFLAEMNFDFSNGIPIT